MLTTIEQIKRTRTYKELEKSSKKQGRPDQNTQAFEILTILLEAGIGNFVSNKELEINVDRIEYEKDEKGNLRLNEFGNPIIVKSSLKYSTRAGYNSRIKELKNMGFDIENTYEDEEGNRLRSNSRFRLNGLYPQPKFETGNLTTKEERDTILRDLMDKARAGEVDDKQITTLYLEEVEKLNKIKQEQE